VSCVSRLHPSDLHPLQPYVRTVTFFLVSFSFLFRLRLSINSLILYNQSLSWFELRLTLEPTTSSAANPAQLDMISPHHVFSHFLRNLTDPHLVNLCREKNKCTRGEIGRQGLLDVSFTKEKTTPIAASGHHHNVDNMHGRERNHNLHQ
jgi:hypothetical protein